MPSARPYAPVLVYSPLAVAGSPSVARALSSAMQSPVGGPGALLDGRLLKTWWTYVLAGDGAAHGSLEDFYEQGNLRARVLYRKRRTRVQSQPRSEPLSGAAGHMLHLGLPKACAASASCLAAHNFYILKSTQMSNLVLIKHL